ncbi:MAG: hypothetical protein IJZ42_00810 [Lachnospiraceae bacterium]|nr:hypothetical protein [Lachnospiraceae bacterium]
MDRNKIIDLLKEQGYPAFMIEKTVDKVENFSQPIKEAFSMWSECGIEPSFSIKGYSYNILIKEFKMKPVGAFITLDWIIREPEKAIESLKRGIM